MAKPNYAFAKRQRDIAKKKKKEEKQQLKAAAKLATPDDNESESSPEAESGLKPSTSEEV